MSRIHEALKKAQQQRGDVAPSDLATPEFASAEVLTGEPETDRVSTMDPVIPPLPVRSADYLRFDDLVARCTHPRWRPLANANVFSAANANPHAPEQFRTLRSRLYQLRQHQPLRTLLVTSALAAEGKTFVASNLAQSIVRQPDRRVLLIDADLRRPRLHVELGAPQSPGLADYLREQADEVGIVQQGQEGNLCFIPGGSDVANPSELLSNGRLKVLLERVAPVFEWVILDSPPCLPVADATALAGLCDGVLLVLRAASTPSELGQKAVQELQGRNVVGAVLNAIDMRDAYGPYQYAAYGYDPDEVKMPVS
jgi:protein-tyrosine kinase